MCSCTPLKFGPLLQEFAKNFSLNVSQVAYKYTNEESFAYYLDILEISAKNIDVAEVDDVCDLYGVLFVYNQLFVPCNLTSGTPRPLCSNSCYFFRSNCSREFDSIIKLISIIAKNSLVYDCGNTFHFINVLSNFANSSKDFEEDCIDISGNMLSNFGFYVLDRSHKIVRYSQQNHLKYDFNGIELFTRYVCICT